MEKKVKFNLVSILMMLAMVVMGVSCGDLSDSLRSTSDTEGPAEPEVPEEPKIDFSYNVVNNGNEAIIEWIISVTNYSLSESGKARIVVSHENDKYAGPVSVSLAYSQERTNHGAIKTTAKASSSDRKVTEDAARTSADVEDGNIVYADRSMERITRTINGKEYELPYIEIGQPYLEAINQLPGTTKYGTRGEKVVTDSVCRGFVWVAPCTVKNYSKEDKFTVTLGDTIRVYQLSDNEIVSGKIVRTDRTPIDENTERCDVVVEWTMLDGSTHEQTYSKILNRRIETIDEYEKVVTAFGYNWLSDNPLSVGNASQVSKDENWTVSGRTDTFSGVLSNNVAPVNTSYGLYHEKAEFANTKFGLKHTFDFENWNPRERNTYEEDINSPRGGYTAKRLNNSISTSYLGYAQDAAESVILLVENAHETSQGWDKSKCTETVSDNRVDWHLEYVTNMSDGTSERVKFDFSDVRNVNCDSNWSSEEKDNTFTTSNVVVSLTNKENHSEEQNGARASWVREYRDMSAEVTLAASKQKNHWTSREANNFTCEYKGKTFSFEAHTLDATNADVLSAGNKEGDFMVYKYSDVLRYVWGNNIQNVTAPGVIRVKEATPEEETFFPPVWGRLLEAKQTVSNNVDHNGFVYVWSLHFEQGVLPVVVVSNSKRPEWHFEYFEYTSIHEYNSGTYLNGTWVNTIASDQFTQMTWGRGNQELANKDYSIAESQNWDEGRRVDGHTSVYTSRYNMQVEAGRLTVTDTYTGTYMGSWK